MDKVELQYQRVHSWLFCMNIQIIRQIKTIYDIYKQFGFHEIKVELSTRPEKRMGEEELWDKAEEALE